MGPCFSCLNIGPSTPWTALGQSFSLTRPKSSLCLSFMSCWFRSSSGFGNLCIEISNQYHRYKNTVKFANVFKHKSNPFNLVIGQKRVTCSNIVGMILDFLFFASKIIQQVHREVRKYNRGIQDHDHIYIYI